MASLRKKTTWLQYGAFICWGQFTAAHHKKKGRWESFLCPTQELYTCLKGTPPLPPTVKTIKVGCFVPSVSSDIWWTAGLKSQVSAGRSSSGTGKSVYSVVMEYFPPHYLVTLTYMQIKCSTAAFIRALSKDYGSMQSYELCKRFSLGCGVQHPPNFPVRPNLRNTPTGHSSSKRTLNAQAFQISQTARCTKTHVVVY